MTPYVNKNSIDNVFVKLKYITDRMVCISKTNKMNTVCMNYTQQQMKCYPTTNEALSTYP